MAGRGSRVLVSRTEAAIVQTLAGILPAAAASYEQCVYDLATPRRSYRGVAHELREVLRETLDKLAPDAAVIAEQGFAYEKDTTRPTQRQKAVHILRKRRLSAEEMSAPELAVTMIEELGGRITRSAYKSGSKQAHSVSSEPDARQLKLWVDAVLAELLAIHGQK